MSETPIEILVVDDSGIMRVILSQLIGGQTDMVVVGEAG